MQLMSVMTPEKLGLGKTAAENASLLHAPWIPFMYSFNLLLMIVIDAVILETSQGQGIPSPNLHWNVDNNIMSSPCILLLQRIFTLFYLRPFLNAEFSWGVSPSECGFKQIHSNIMSAQHLTYSRQSFTDLRRTLSLSSWGRNVGNSSNRRLAPPSAHTRSRTSHTKLEYIPKTPHIQSNCTSSSYPRETTQLLKNPVCPPRTIWTTATTYPFALTRFWTHIALQRKQLSAWETNERKNNSLSTCCAICHVRLCLVKRAGGEEVDYLVATELVWNWGGGNSVQWGLGSAVNRRRGHVVCPQPGSEKNL